MQETPVWFLGQKIPWRRGGQPTPVFLGFLGGSDGKAFACNVGDLGSIPGLGRSPWGGHGNPLQFSCLENPHGQRSLAIYSPWDCKEADTTERPSTAHGNGKGGWDQLRKRWLEMEGLRNWKGHILRQRVSVNVEITRSYHRNRGKKETVNQVLKSSVMWFWDHKVTSRSSWWCNPMSSASEELDLLKDTSGDKEQKL